MRRPAGRKEEPHYSLLPKPTQTPTYCHTPFPCPCMRQVDWEGGEFLCDCNYPMGCAMEWMWNWSWRPIHGGGWSGLGHCLPNLLYSPPSLALPFVVHCCVPSFVPWPSFPASVALCSVPKHLACHRPHAPLPLTPTTHLPPCPCFCSLPFMPHPLALTHPCLSPHNLLPSSFLPPSINSCILYSYYELHQSPSSHLSLSLSLICLSKLVSLFLPCALGNLENRHFDFGCLAFLGSGDSGGGERRR